MLRGAAGGEPGTLSGPFQLRHPRDVGPGRECLEAVGKGPHGGCMDQLEPSILGSFHTSSTPTIKKLLACVCRFGFMSRFQELSRGTGSKYFVLAFASAQPSSGRPTPSFARWTHCFAQTSPQSNGGALCMPRTSR